MQWDEEAHGQYGGCGNCIHTFIAIKKSIMDKMHVGMMGMPSEDSNNESSDGTVYEDKTVEENAVYKDENVDENVVSLLAPSLPPLLPCAIPQQQEQNNEELVAIMAAAPEKMFEEGDADG